MNTEQKQSINLSSYAYSILQDDMKMFSPLQTFNGFLNEILERYSAQADASIHTALERQQDRLRNAVERNPRLQSGLSDDQRERLVHLLDEETETVLLEKSRLYNSGRSFTFRLNNRNYQHFFLERNGAEWPDIRYYGGFYSRYFKAVIEEYCELPRFKREEVYFRNYIDTIQQAIDMTSVLRIRIESPFSAAETETWDVRPFDILPDPAHIYHYLVGRSVHAGGPRNEEKIASIRLSRIRDISILNKKTHRSGMLSAAEKKEIRQKISLRSVSFLIGDEHEVIIRFTEDGKRMYQNTLFMRPHLQEVDEDGHYHFLCTQMQALQYFIRFGANAEILSPNDLRESFAEVFNKAADIYSK